MPDLRSERLVVATHNDGKLREISALLSPYGVDVTSAGALGLDEPEETEDSFEGNARIKAHAAAKASGLIALSDDSGLMVDALDGAPGVYTADWAETPDGRDFMIAMTKVQNRLAHLDAAQPWSARFCCTLCLAWPDGSDQIFAGEVAGQLVWPVRGSQGFGFDPMFMPDGHSKTFGEMTPAQKAPLTHRTDAFGTMVRACFT
ncbi:MAG: RdgB/HAM1 family non-canonical purine NTP pyrophosphatase [Rhodobacteraceae bacterium]|nr:RdgB/HAM1 family non-canonical purine NTP pyrophosphatase [Paracoccaceae bacterium]